MAYENFKKTITTAGTAGVPKSPIGNFPELNKYFAATFALPQSQAGANALAQAASQDAQAARAAASASRAAERARIKDQIDRIEKFKKGEGFYKVKKEDGGFDFFDTFDRKIDVQTFAMAQNKKVADVIRDSENNLDRQFLEDHGTYEKVLNALANNDTGFFNEMKEKDPNEYKALQELTGNFKRTPEEVSKIFMQLYGNYYGGGNQPELRTLQDSGDSGPPGPSVLARLNTVPGLGRLIPDRFEREYQQALQNYRPSSSGPFSQFRNTLGGF